MPLNAFEKLAILTNKYSLVKPIRQVIARWTSELVPCSDWRNKVSNIEARITISWIFGLQEDFKKVLADLVNEAHVNED
jgi:hypothetical protein